MKRTIAAAQLRPGMYLHKLCGAWLEHPFWRTSFLIEDQDTIDQILASGIEEVVIDTDRGFDVDADGEDDAAPEAASPAPEMPVAAPAPPRAVTAQLPLADEVQRARRICQEGKRAVQSMLEEARLGKVVRTEAALPVVEEITASVLRSPNALISVARLKTADDYTYLHSVAVCAMMVALAKQLGLDEAQTREAGLGGLLHDLGKACTPLAILNKPGPLTDAEFEVMRRHPADGYRMLQDAGFEHAAAMDVTLHHHEKVDGNGYPHKLAGSDIALLARMGAVCDVYDAVTSNRPYKQGWDPAESIRRMSSWKGHFDETVLRAFIKSLGIYPVGALVRLKSDKLGVVVEQNPGELLRPVVKVFYSARSNTQVMLHRIDLAERGCQDQIVSVEDAVKWGFRNLERLWMG